MRDISKRFDATQALDGVSLSLFPGEVHALLGENGAGKSTLIKVMTGIHAPDAGEIVVGGEPVTLRSSADAQRHGIAAIYQEPLIFPDLNVAENIFIGHHDRGRVVHWGRMYREAEGILGRLDVHLDVRTPASNLSVATQQAVEIAKAISLDVRVLIMDEPTAALSAHEADRLFTQIRRLSEDGVAILFISHRLDEVFSIADRITVFRDGNLVSSRPRAEANQGQAIREMVGREIASFFARTDHAIGEPILRVENLGMGDAFDRVSFELHRGEVLGFAGLVGSGRTDIGLALFGVAPATRGEITLRGSPVRIPSPRRALGFGIAYVSEDRRKLGLSMPQSITANITLPVLRRYVSRLGLVDTRRERETAEGYRKRLRIQTESVDATVDRLSGGNQQKTMLAKWLNVTPQVLILDEPTRGIDVGAKAEVHQIISDLAQSQMAIILISSELPEVLAMSDRVLVMREGLQVALLERVEANEEKVMTAAMGAAA
ncbi:MAG: sugar ABC transporter ATP-binding protein [Candidatus Limnocylindria bacterium]